MSYEFYKTAHIISLLFVFLGLGGLLFASYSGVTLNRRARLLTFLSHGIGLAFVLISGFGMAARLGFFGALPSWIYTKLGLWLGLGLVMSAIKRRGKFGSVWFATVGLLGGLAVYIVIHKPI